MPDIFPLSGTPSDFPWTPHVVLWKAKKDTRRGGNANDGKAESIEPSAVNVFVEAKSAEWAARTYGVEVERRPYLVIGKADAMEPIQMGDELVFEGRTLEVAFAPTIHRYGDGYDHGECMAMGEKTGGRIL